MGESSRYGIVEVALREWQRRAFEHILRILKDGRIPEIISAPGTGKTWFDCYLSQWFVKQPGYPTSVIVLPTKTLQYQARDFIVKYKQIRGDVNIVILLGRDNFKCPFSKEYLGEVTTCADTRLPCVKKSIRRVRRYELAKKCPYYSPVLSSRRQFEALKDVIPDAEIYDTYENHLEDNVILVTREKGNCPYYAQYLDLVDADIVIYNFTKFIVDYVLGRIPRMGLLIIDEYDQFLDEYMRGKIEVSLDELLYYRRLAREEGETELVANLNYCIGYIRRACKGWKTRKYRGETEQLSLFIAHLLKAYRIIKDAVEDPEIHSKTLALELMVRRGYNVASLPIWEVGGSMKIMLVLRDTGFVAKMLREMSKSVILSSATPLENAYNYGLHKNLMIRVEGIKRFEPAVIPIGTFTLPLSSKKKLESRAYAQMYWGELKRCYELALEGGGRLLVLTNAWHLVEGLEELKPHLDKTGELLQEFKQGKRDIVVSTRFRGEDVRGVEKILIVKYPLPDYTSDPYWRIVMEGYSDTMGRVSNKFFRLLHQWTLRKFYHGICRLRPPGDRIYVYSPDYYVLRGLKKLEENGFIRIGREEAPREVLKMIGEKR